MILWVDCKDGIFHRKIKDNNWGPMVVTCSQMRWKMMGAQMIILYRIFALNIQRTEPEDFNQNYSYIYDPPSLHTWWWIFWPSGLNLYLRAGKLPGKTCRGAEETDLIFLSSLPEVCRISKTKKSMSKEQAYLLNEVRNEADNFIKKVEIAWMSLGEALAK